MLLSTFAKFLNTFLSCSAAFLLFICDPVQAADVKLAWTDIENAQGYRVFKRSDSEDYNYNKPAWTGSVLNCTIRDLSEFKKYYFVVRAYAETLESSDSNEVLFPSNLPIDFRIDAVAGPNGTITPNGIVNVPNGGVQDFKIEPATGYRIDNVKIDGLSKGAISSYRFEDLSDNHTIEACFTNTEGDISVLPGTSVVIDNGDKRTISSGKWQMSNAPFPHGDESFFSKEIGAEYEYTLDTAGSYDVALWWTAHRNRCTEVPVEIYDGNLLLETVFVNQQQDAAQWNSIGTYDFAEMPRIVIVSESNDCSTSADAVNFVNLLFIIDDSSQDMAFDDLWFFSSGTDPYGSNSLYSRHEGSVYTFEAALNGFFSVNLWWTSIAGRCDNVPVHIHDGDRLIDTIYIDQNDNGGQWNELGQYEFNGIAKVSLLSTGPMCSTCADAVAFSLEYK